MRKFMVIAIPVVSLLIFIAIMLSGDLLKKPLGDDDNIPEAIDELIEQSRWKNGMKRALK